MLEKYAKKELLKNYITKKDASELLGVSERTINNYITDGKLDILLVNKTRYINRKDLEKYLDKVTKRKTA